ncbi:MAG: hypothetical protein VX701_07370 [Chloroflexota bacterium]|nr:hypothetical protein [Chloroflexota bacterium]
MKFHKIDPPRNFKVNEDVSMSDWGRIELSPDEQVTFSTESGAEYDVARKSWGFYATPSLNGRLVKYGLRAALVKNSESKFYLMLVENGKEDQFLEYLNSESQKLVSWLDSEEVLQDISDAFERGNY